MSHFDIDKYAGLRSPIHSFDARAKTVCFFLLIISLSLLENLLVQFFALLVVLVIVLSSNIPLSFVASRLKWVVFFIFMVAVLLPFTMGSEAILSLGFIHLYREGSLRAVSISLKAISIVLMMFPLLGTMRFVDFLKALEKLRLPGKLVQVVALTYRYIFVLLNQIKQTMISMESRGYKKRGMLFRPRIIGNVIGTFLLRSYEKSEKVSRAMASRGYDGTMRTMCHFRVTFQDKSMILLFTAIAVLLQILEYIDP